MRFRIDPQTAVSREGIGGPFTVSIIKTVAQPEYFRRATELCLFESGDGGCAVRQPGLGRSFARATLRLAGRKKCECWRWRCRRHDCNGSAGLRCGRKRRSDGGTARVPASGRGPAIVDEQDERTFARKRWTFAKLGLGKRNHD